MLTTGLKSGKHDNVYFSKPSYNHGGDIFKEAASSVIRSSSKDGFLKAGHEKNFAPAIANKESLHKASFGHMSDLKLVKK